MPSELVQIIYATLKQRLDAVHKLRFQHDIQTLCRVLNVNRSTYYKHYHNRPAPRISENQRLKSMILHIYADYDKRLGAYKVQYILRRDYGVNISVGRVYHLMNSMNLPQMSTRKPKPSCRPADNGECANHLQQRFSQNAPNTFNELYLSVFEYIEGYYNSRRPHGSLGYLTPNEMESAYWRQD